MEEQKPVHIQYHNGHETIINGEITGYRTMFLFIPLGDEMPVINTTKQFEFPDGTIWEGIIQNKWADINWHYGKNGELLGIKQKVSISYTVKHEGKKSKLKRFKIYAE